MTLHFDYCLSASDTFLEAASMVGTWWIVAFWGSVILLNDAEKELY